MQAFLVTTSDLLSSLLERKDPAICIVNLSKYNF